MAPTQLLLALELGGCVGYSRCTEPTIIPIPETDEPSQYRDLLNRRTTRALKLASIIN
jgi:hypothetical protein